MSTTEIGIAWEYSDVNVTYNSTATWKDAGPPETVFTPLRVMMCSILYLIILITTIGNIMVIVSPLYEKKLRNTFIYYVINLAVTDLGVAVTAMSFYTTDILLGWWPFGEIMCGIWIFCDYGFTFASVFTLVLVSFDRYWSVQWYLHYRNNNTKKKCIIGITCVWLLMVAIWLAPCIKDRVDNSVPYICIWEPSNNPEFVIFIAVVGHHLPCFLMVFFYVRVFMAMQKRAKLGGRNKVAPMETSQAVTISNTPPATSTNDDETVMETTAPGNTLTVPQTNQRKKKKETSVDKEKKIFVTLSYIIISYLICWVPFHVVFDISAINPDLVPSGVYSFTFWLTYFNSTLNPFLYAFSSAEFRSAFKKVIRCQGRK